MSSKPNDTPSVIFDTRNIFGQLTAPDSTPTGSVYHNGVVDATIAVNLTSITTSTFCASFTIPIAYSAGDSVQVRITWTISGAADEFLSPIYILDSARIYDITAGLTNARAIVEGYASGQDPGTLLGTTLTGLQSAVLSLQALASSISTAAYTTDNATPGSVVALPRDPLTGFPLLRLAAGQTDATLTWQTEDLTGNTGATVKLFSENGEELGSYAATTGYSTVNSVNQWYLSLTTWPDTTYMQGRYTAIGFVTLVNGKVHSTVNAPVIVEIDY